ncbi:MAG: hypothetical protein J6I54_00555 [Bacteroidaceae bacterium]|nr:hypothetical protein [Bacteroidaceae bacterium]
MRNTGCIDKLKTAADKLGLCLVKCGGFYELEYGQLPICVLISNTNDSFCLISCVYDQDDCLDEELLDIAVDVVTERYEQYSGYWNDALPYFMSPEYIVGADVPVTHEWLGKKLDDFYRASMLLQKSILLMNNASVAACLM